jgi:hypothetical protein
MLEVCSCGRRHILIVAIAEFVWKIGWARTLFDTIRASNVRWRGFGVYIRICMACCR